MSSRRNESLPIPGLRWRGLTLQVFIWVVLPLTAVLLVIAVASLTLHQRAMRTLVGERDERAARTAASSLSEQLLHRADGIRGLALRATDGTSLEEILESSDFLQDDFDGGMAFFSHQGEPLAVQGSDVFWEQLTFENEDLIMGLVARSAPDPIFSAPFLHPSTGDPLILVSAALSGDVPIAVGSFSPATLARDALAGTISPGDQTLLLVVDANGQILYRAGEIDVPQKLSELPGVNQALQGESGTIYLTWEGNEHVIAFSPISPIGWALVIEEPWEAVASPLLNTTQLAPLILVPVLLLALVALWFGARRIVQPLQDLEIQAAELAWGDFEAIEKPVGGIDEVERLQNTLIHLAHKVRSAQQSLRGYIGAITAGQEEERRRLARELHDDTIQALVALNQRVQLARLSSEDNKVNEHLSEIQGLTEQTISDLRRLTRALRPHYLEDLGLVAALEALVNDTDQMVETDIDFQQHGAERRLSPEREIALYRMAQEALSNIVRHANAEYAFLNIRFESNGVSLIVADDGRGFKVPDSPAEFAPEGHFGLLGMHERAELVGAQLDIRSVPGEGTRLIVIIPHSNIEKRA